jgi:hypothetical protein
MKQEAARKLTTLFILPVTVLTVFRLSGHFVNVKERTVCMNCYGGMEVDFMYMLLSVAYLTMVYSGVGKSVHVYMFYAITAFTFVMFAKLVRQMISKARTMTGKTPVSIGAEAAAAVAVESGKSSSSSAEAKQKGGKEGAIAAEEAAVSAGLSEKEVVEAVVAGKETGEVIAEKVADLS